MKTGIHIKPCNIQSAVAHNLRTEEYMQALDKSGKATYDIFRDLTDTNSSWVNLGYQGKELTDILADLKVIAKKRTGRTMQAKATPIREGVCPIKPDTTVEDFFGVINWAAKHGFRVIGIYLHHDEGHIDATTGERKLNHHAHIVFEWFNRTTGKSPRLPREKMSELQTVLADSLRMERGESKIMTGAKHLSPAEYREQKAIENFRTLSQELSKIENKISFAGKVYTALQSKIGELSEELAHLTTQTDTARREVAKESILTSFTEIVANIAKLFDTGRLKSAEKALKEAENEISSLRQRNSSLMAEKSVKRLNPADFEKIAKDCKVEAVAFSPQEQKEPKKQRKHSR